MVCDDQEVVGEGETRVHNRSRLRVSPRVSPAAGDDRIDQGIGVVAGGEELDRLSGGEDPRGSE